MKKRTIKTLCRPLLLLLAVIPVVLFGSETPAQQQWTAFLNNPSARTYESLSAVIQACAVRNCHDADVVGKENNFEDFEKLLNLTERGNQYAMEIAFQIRPLYKDAAAPTEDIDRSLGLSCTAQPAFFLGLIKKYDISGQTSDDLVVQTSSNSVDDLHAQREEWTARMRALSSVMDPNLRKLRDRAVSAIQREVEQHAGLSDDASTR